jgi:hypothetical protein
VQALTRKVNLSDMMDGIDLDDDDLSSFFCSEHTAEALKRAALNHSGEGPYGVAWNDTKETKSSNHSPADLAKIPIVGTPTFLKRQMTADLKAITTKEDAALEILQPKEAGAAPTHIGVLKLIAKAAEKLDDADVFTKSDPYLVCEMQEGGAAAADADDKGYRKTTKVVDNSLSPVWNETMSINVPSLESELVVACSDCEKSLGSYKNTAEGREGDEVLGVADAIKISELIGARNETAPLFLIFFFFFFGFSWCASRACLGKSLVSCDENSTIKCRGLSAVEGGGSKQLKLTLAKDGKPAGTVHLVATYIPL